jgi:diketogulonate reductase-like aldo/keto reductase
MSRLANIILNDGNHSPLFGFGTGKICPYHPEWSLTLNPVHAWLNVCVLTMYVATALLKGADGMGDCSNTLLTAIQKGFRHIDTAATYPGNEAAVGKLMEEWESQGGKRSDVVITTKWGYSADLSEDHDPDALLERILERMDVDQIDLCKSMRAHNGGNQADFDQTMHEPFVSHSGSRRSKDRSWPSQPRPLSLGEAWKKMEGYKKDGRVLSIGVSNFASKHIEELAKTWTVPPVVNEVGGLSSFRCETLMS